MDSIKYRHSNEFPSEVWNSARCPTRFRPRISKYASIADEACWAVRDEMVAAGASKEITQGVGCVDSISGNAMAIWFPEALPDRMYIASYMIEFAFMHDDLTDSAKTPQEFDESNQALLDSLESSAQDDIKRGKKLAMKTLQARFSVEALEIDEQIGTWLLQEWKRQFSVSSEKRILEYTSIRDYLEFRIVDAGAEIFLVVMRFVSDTNITKAEINRVKYISDLILYAQILWHDYASWQKEIDAFKSGESCSMVNALSIIMKLHNIDEESAKKILWQETLEYERKYCEERDLFIKEHCPGPEFYRWFKLLELSTGGNAIWSCTSPRYHKSSPRPGRPQSTSELSTKEKTDCYLQVDSSQYREFIADKAAIDGSKYPSSANGTIQNITQKKARKIESNDYPEARRAKLNKTGDYKAKEGSHALSNKLLVKEDIVVLEAYKYISALQGKGARDQLIDALNSWYSVPETSLSTIRYVIEVLHNVSLMLDDIQDNSPMRRGFPSTHVIFGSSQTINSATYMYTKGLEAAMRLSPKTMISLFEELSELHIGQAHDLHEAYHCKPPSEPQYFKRIEQKTGGLFRMSSKMMQAEATRNKDVNIDALMTMLGRFYQIRDDYHDLTGLSIGKSTHYNDLDQGAFTLPIIHALKQQEKKGSTELLSVLQSRKHNEGMTPEMKMFVMKRIEDGGSLDYTKETLAGLHFEMKEELNRLEEIVHEKNWILRLLLHRLKV